MPPLWTPPSEFDEYRLLEPLGHGSMGQVWSARDALLERRVAIKFIGSARDAPTLRARFLVEARAAARIQHPNVVAVYRVGDAFGHPYTVTELLTGKSLDRIERPLSSDRLLDLGTQLARGLAAAHRRGVLHRDLKPANAFLTDTGEVKILDFGLAKLNPALAQERPSPARKGRRSGEPREFTPNALNVTDAAATVPDAPAPDPLASTFAETAPSIGATAREEVSAAAAPMASAALPLSAAGTVVGTPYYLAPECWDGAAATCTSDVYSLGALLYELAAGRPPSVYLSDGPLVAPLADVVRAKDARPLAETAPQLDPRIAGIIERCLARDPSRRYATADALREAFERLAPAASRLLPEGNPYRGLLAFEAEHRAVFFGRQAEGRLVLERLKSDGCVVVAGDSGAGKSSLCRAAVLPACAEGALGEAASLSIATLLPGRRPLTTLASALEGPLGIDEASIFEALLAAPDEAAAYLRHALGRARRLLIFIDQLEELVTSAEPAEADILARVFVALASRSPGVRLLASVRSDLLGRVAGCAPGLADVLGRSLVLLGPPSADALREIVTGPAHLKGYAFESEDVVAALVSFAGRPGALPLLQFALAALWEARDEARRLLPREALRRLGGAEGALAQHAENTLELLAPEEAAAAREVLLSLVAENGTRRRASRDELIRGDGRRRAALEALLRARLLVARSSAGVEGHEIAHEALITAWPRLRDWLDDDAGARALRERIERAAAEWERLGQPPEALWGRRQLAELERLTELPSSDVARAFVAASRRSERLRRFRLPAAAAALTLAAVAAWGGARLAQHREVSTRVAARLAEGEAAARAVHAQEQAWRRAREEAYRAFDQGKWPEGEALWRAARAERAKVAEAAARASAAYESALLLDSSRADAKDRLADWILDRALSADEAGDEPGRDDLLVRLAMLDESGARAARFGERAAVALRLDPPSARARITRYRLEEARYVTETPRDFAGGPLDPGSWLLEARAEGYAPVRLPLLLRRGERRDISLRLLPAGRVPPGFIHVPAGRFLFGADGDDELRRVFFEAAPIHPVETGEYLIARHEITYEDYLPYIRALPPAERQARLPGAGLGAVEGSGVALSEEGGRFVLTFQMTGPVYRAREGEPLVYQSRATRASHDWGKLPVLGISANDAEEYARWLDQTGRVTGARLCTEIEWERAARGADRRSYPHGEVLSADEANIDETYGRKDGAFGPDEVGSHPASTSPFGVDDLVGNAWDLVRAARPGAVVVARGGSFYVGQLTARSINQWAMTPTFRHVETGVRLCADVQ
ncbi:nSTAND1 domain-containing NTPase [Sorangium sp. So ce1389]|uniref:nSTAND1 domain-containing NTPase n=1 Tax=Sorangium sp. So ce1389 TaxID=3133336 RepID=UPI003F61F181